MANLPNLITIFRILLIPVLVVLLTDPGRTASVLATLTFFVACWSDFLDGYLARRWGNSTTLGKLLDPLADKFIVLVRVLVIVLDPVISSTSITITRTSTASLSTILELPRTAPQAHKPPLPSSP